jgi:phosphate uptake regulator
MKRKLVKQGTTTLMVSLPSKWIKANNLDKGSEIDITEKDNDLSISIQKQIKKKELTLSIKGYSPTAIRSLLTNAYRLQYDKITIEYTNEQDIVKIEQILKNTLIGFEIVSRTEKYCTIENITEPSIEHTDIIFNRLLHNIKELFESTKKQLLGNGEFTYINELEENIQRYDNFCRRLSMTSQYATLLVAFYKEIAQAQREIYYIAEYTSKKRTKISNETIKLFDEMIKMFEKLREAYQKNDLSLIEEMHSKEKELIYTEGYSLLRKKKGDESIILFRIMTAIRMLYLSVSPLIGIIYMLTQE